jgi:predicted transcriptional regulator
MEEKALYQELLKLIVPKEITDNFELIEIVERTNMITLSFEELASRIPKPLIGKEVVLDGYLNQLELQTFPLKDKTVYIALRRRRWKEKGDSKQSYSNTYELHVEGMKTTKEFGAFLKEEFGLQPDEYNKLWKSITG